MCRLGFDSVFVINREERSSGVYVLWCFTDICSMVGFLKNHIDIEVCEDGVTKWRTVGFYGMLVRNKRRLSWNLIQNQHSFSLLSWCYISDFNDMLNSDDMRDGVEHPNWLF